MMTDLYKLLEENSIAIDVIFEKLHQLTYKYNGSSVQQIQVSTVEGDSKLLEIQALNEELNKTLEIVMVK
jgi:hypothetical protein